MPNSLKTVRDLSYDPASFILGVLLGILLGIVMGATITEICLSDSWREEAISRGVAEYNQRTGEWQWTKEKVITANHITTPSISSTYDILAEDKKHIDGAEKPK